MQEIAVRRVHLDRVDAEPLGALRGGHEGVAHPCKTRGIECQRRRLALLVRNRRRALRPPAALRHRDQLPAVPRRVARGLAAGVGELDHHLSLRALAHRGQDRPQRGFGGVVVEAEAARRDAADRLHRGGLDAEDRGPRQRQRIDVGEMPVIGLAVDGRVLAHRRHHDAVGKREIAQLDRGKQSAHRLMIRTGRESDPSSLASRSPLLNPPGLQPSPYGLMPAALISSRLAAVSRLTRSSISAGFIGIGSMPSFFRLACIAGSASTFPPAACNFSTISRGVFAGANTPNQITLSASCNPISRGVGTSGRSAARLGVETTSARTWPSRIKGSAVASGQKYRSIRPPRISAITSGPARYGTCVASMPAARRNFSVLICTALPMPTDPNEIEPGLALASAMKSWMIFQGRAFGTIITLALDPIISTEARSRTGSKLALGKIAGAIASADDWARRLQPSGSAFATSAEPTVPPPPARFSITIDWPSSAARRSNTSRGTTSAALPAPNGMVALISRDGQPSACATVAAKKLVRTQTARRDLYIESSGLITPSGARTIPLFACHPTSVNCSSRLRWIIEKLSSETSVSTISPSGVTWASMPSMLSISWPRSASKIEGPSITAPGAMEASGMRRIRMPTPPSQENFRSSNNRAPDGSSTASLTSKFSVRRTLNSPSVLPIRKAVMLPCASSPRSEIAISVPASGKPFGTTTSASIPLL